ncbi:ComEA family DNA-binding protein [Paraconexibacter algicola]|uniref:Helix-hairpin-helix DNA-binding motif class 1 domain-containing protein n=1 Tax=Paraconexibacter algicola TaxID=2133960 RepID=A0A2T4UEP9_9ACTN|nr:ComEA family DNA-binding protein [Paraconexibacter algicola]PTL56263.1 hypothetical protein C7Y72_14885 [Paraconexibacter algicola]
MTEVPRTQVVLYVLVVAAVALLGARALRPQVLPDPAAPAAPATAGGRDPSDSAETSSAEPAVRTPAGRRVVVHVAGAVRRPGVYRLREGDRVGDAVRRAGGGRGGADLDQVNLAAKVTDGQQVLVPARAGTAAAGVAAATGPAGTAPGVPLNLNTATLEQLDTLDGVGPATAQKIVDERTRRGGFRSVEDLGDVPGIGPKRLEALRDRVRV